MFSLTVLRKHRVWKKIKIGYSSHSCFGSRQTTIHNWLKKNTKKNQQIVFFLNLKISRYLGDGINYVVNSTVTCSGFATLPDLSDLAFFPCVRLIFLYLICNFSTDSAFLLLLFLHFAWCAHNFGTFSYDIAFCFSQGVVTLTGCKDLSGKHPVSALTELCSKRRWGPPMFSQAFECGPPHKKQFIFKVSRVNYSDHSNLCLLRQILLDKTF